LQQHYHHSKHTTTTGIGFETAKVLAGKGYSVTLACRDNAKAAAAVAAIKASQPGANVDSIYLDLANLATVRDAAAAWLDSGRQIDVLLNNAGVRVCWRQRHASTGWTRLPAGPSGRLQESVSEPLLLMHALAACQQRLWHRLPHDARCCLAAAVGCTRTQA
jgi:NAD(P)-dependent dehydrogenase (short-subunit alcohol dehydrogenase family)